VSDPGGGTQQPPSENDEYASDEIVLPPANGILRPRRSFAPILILMVFGITAVLAAIGISRLDDPNNLPAPSPHDERAPVAKQPDRFSEQSTEPPEPLRSLVLDAAQSYLVRGGPPFAKPSPATR
jgi:hypothetical protein